MEALPDVRESVRLLRSEVLEPVAGRFAGREELIELVALALAASENLLIIGPPGTAKSRIIPRSRRASRGASSSACSPGSRSHPMSRTRRPEGASRGEGRDAHRGHAPDAEIVFLDEVFNAGSAILNSLLGIINDGVFRRGSETRKTDLISILGATNRIPDDPALRALEDRFTLRVEARSMEPDRHPGPPRARLGHRARAAARRRTAPAVPLRHEPPEADPCGPRRRGPRPRSRGIADAVKRIRSAGVFLSDRRAVKLQGLVAGSSAVLCGRRAAVPADIRPLRYLWEAPEDAPLLEEIAADCSAPESSGGDLEAGAEIHSARGRPRSPPTSLAGPRGSRGRPGPAAPRRPLAR